MSVLIKYSNHHIFLGSYPISYDNLISYSLASYFVFPILHVHVLCSLSASQPDVTWAPSTLTLLDWTSVQIGWRPWEHTHTLWFSVWDIHSDTYTPNALSLVVVVKGSSEALRTYMVGSPAFGLILWESSLVQEDSDVWWNFCYSRTHSPLWEAINL